jgi:biotin carboxyl carrier protein
MTTHLLIDGRTYKVVVLPDGTAEIDGEPLPVTVCELAPGVLSILFTHADGRVQSFQCIADSRPDDAAVLIDGQRISYWINDPRSLRATFATSSATGPRALKSPMPGRIVRVLVRAGDAVEAGQGCVVIEAMKMQNELKAPKSGTISKLTAVVGETVAAGASLLIIE